MAVKTRVFASAAIRPLSKNEIDRQIDWLSNEVVAEEAGVGSDDNCHPRWISARELVRRMRPFLVLN